MPLACIADHRRARHCCSFRILLPLALPPPLCHFAPMVLVSRRSAEMCLIPGKSLFRNLRRIPNHSPNFARSNLLRRGSRGSAEALLPQLQVKTRCHTKTVSAAPNHGFLPENFKLLLCHRRRPGITLVSRPAFGASYLK